MGRSPCCSKEGMNRGAWTALEDKILTEFIKVHGEGRWRNLPKKAGLKRCGKSCRLRWLNYLRPDIKRGNISPDEEELIIRLHRLLGNRWSLIAGRLPGRTDNEIKNYWNTNLGKKVKDPSKSTSSLKQLEKKITPAARPAVEAPRVVRTKAIKCTKVAFLPQPLHQIQHLELAPFMTKQENKESESGNGESSFTTGDNNSPDFSMDLNNGELGLSDFLCSDFSELFNMDNAIENEFSPSSDQSLLFTDGMPVDWTGSDPVRPEIDSDLNFLTSFLISEGDYLDS